MCRTLPACTEYRKAKKEMDERKAALVEALATKAAALLQVGWTGVASNRC